MLTRWLKLTTCYTIYVHVQLISRSAQPALAELEPPAFFLATPPAQKLGLLVSVTQDRLEPRGLIDRPDPH